jgi:glucosamine-6-phosphate deaminase
MPKIDLLTTIRGSLLEGFFPRGWDLARLDALAGQSPEATLRRAPHWHRDFEPVPAGDVRELEVLMGIEIAAVIAEARQAGKELALILPVGPMGMYRWTIAVLARSGVACDHVHGFNMDEWSDAEGNTLPGDQVGSFQDAMEQAFYGPLGKLTVPPRQRCFATREALPRYAGEIAELRARGARLAVVYGIGRVLHIAFWEPHFAGEFPDEAAWRRETHRLGARLHPLTIEQNAITSFKSRTTLVPAFANTIGPGLFLAADHAIGGADGTLGRGMMWQGLSLKVALQHGPDPWLPATYMPGLPGRLFFDRALLGPLEPECN